MPAATAIPRFILHHTRETASTNDLARESAARGDAEGQVFITEHQTAGRGKPGRKWISPAGKNLLFSIMLRPPVGAHQAPLITQIACRSVAAVLEKHYAVKSTFKRPNDILVNGKKLCGVLTEAATRSDGDLESVIVGIGLNVNSAVGELIPEATSLLMIKGREYDKNRLVNRLLSQFKKDLRPFYGTRTGHR